MDLIIAIASEAIDDEDLQEVARDICWKINRELDVNAELMTEPNIKGARSAGLESIGTLVIPLGIEIIETMSLHFVAITLLAILGPHLKREPTIEIKVKCDGGKFIMLKDGQLNSDQLGKVLDILKNVPGVSK